MEQFTNLPPIKWSMRHPRIAAWAVLAIGMVLFLVIEARNVGLQAGNWIALIIATVLVAGACIWIISWEDGDESEPDPNIKTKTGEIPKVVIPSDTTSQADLHQPMMTSNDEERVRNLATDAHAQSDDAGAEPAESSGGSGDSSADSGGSDASSSD